jgi:hypothetical protein
MRASTRNEIQFCNACALFRRGYEFRAPIELVYDLEDVLFDLLWCYPRREETANSKVFGTTRAFGYQ